jgi:prevent-host-death family protein
MRKINVHQAKTNFSKLLVEVELGEEIIIANRGVPVAKLVPFHGAANRRASLGQDRGCFVVPEDFNVE